MGMGLTIGIIVIAFAVFAGALYISRKPVEPGEVSMIPYGGIQFLAIVVVLVALAHLISLVSGEPFTSRFGL